MRLTLISAALCLLSSLALSPYWCLIGLAIGAGIVAVIACGLGVVAYVRTANEGE